MFGGIGLDLRMLIRLDVVAAKTLVELQAIVLVDNAALCCSAAVGACGANFRRIPNGGKLNCRPKISTGYGFSREITGLDTERRNSFYSRQ